MAIAKAARRLIPFLCLCYIVNFLDRVNVGFAALAMNQDLGFSPSVYGAGAGIFFIGYFLFEIPSNLALQKFGARIWIARIMISWGLVACAMALVLSETSFYVMRFLLGVAEAGFFPGVILYLTYWFPAARAGAHRLAVHGGGAAGDGGRRPDVGRAARAARARRAQGLALAVRRRGPAGDRARRDRAQIPRRPARAGGAGSNAEERQALAETLAAEAKATRATGYAGLGQALTRPRVLVLGLLYFCLVVGLYGIGFWMPQVIQAFGLEPLRIGFLTAIPYLFAAIAMVLWGARSDRANERIWHVALPLLLGGAAFAWSAFTGPLWLTMVGAHPRHGRHLCRHRHVLVAADRDPDRHRRGGGAGAGQLAGQSRRARRPVDRRGDPAGDRLVHRRAAVPGRRAGDRAAIALLFGYWQRERVLAQNSSNP